MDLAQLLGGMSRHEDESSGLTDGQIANRLREAAALFVEEHEFSYGDIIIHKLRSQAAFQSADKPTVFMGYLAEKVIVRNIPITEAREAFSNAFSAELDCRIGILMGERFTVVLAESSWYAPHPDFPNH